MYVYTSVAKTCINESVEPQIRTAKHYQRKTFAARYGDPDGFWRTRVMNIGPKPRNVIK